MRFLTITLAGAILATAPLALADSHWAASYAHAHVRQVAARTAPTLREWAATARTSA